VATNDGAAARHLVSTSAFDDVLPLAGNDGGAAESLRRRRRAVYRRHCAATHVFVCVRTRCAHGCVMTTNFNVCHAFNDVLTAVTALGVNNGADASCARRRKSRRGWRGSLASDALSWRRQQTLPYLWRASFIRCAAAINGVFYIRATPRISWRAFCPGSGRTANKMRVVPSEHGISSGRAHHAAKSTIL